MATACQRVSSRMRPRPPRQAAPAEHERLRAHDWAAESPRLAGRALFEELPGAGRGASPTVRLAKIEGACAFLEPDQLCLIHKTMGLEAKPGPCQQYPFHFAGT